MHTNTSLLIIFQGSQEEWQRVFFLCGGIYVLGWLVYLVFGRGELQSWAVVADDEMSGENVPYERHFSSDNEYNSSHRRSHTLDSSDEDDGGFQNRAYIDNTDLGTQNINMNVTETTAGDSII